MNRPALVSSLLFGVFAVILWLHSPPSGSGVPEPEPSERYPGGDTTVSIQPAPSFLLPAGNLSQDRKPDFYAGKSLAELPWVKAPTATTARDGLGPMYNARTCLACHVNGGRGQVPEGDRQMLFSSILRLSLPGTDPVLGVVPEPVYGDQLQSQSVALSHQLRGQAGAEQTRADEIAPEGEAYVSWTEQDFSYPDGTRVSLRKPSVSIRHLGYGDLHADTLMSLRNAPPILGVGLLEMIDQADIDRLADPQDRNDDGISGRVNMSRDFETQQPRPGRFGYKANKVSVRTQVAAAMQGDIGISSPVFRQQPCTRQQIRCRHSPNGNDADGFELPEKLLRLIVQFNMELGVPERRKPNDPMVLQGRRLFYTNGCTSCHHPGYTTGNSAEYPALSHQHIWPYTDLLLHDMGPGLSDGRADYSAGGSEWRTAPLWGVGLSPAVNGSKNYLHDGRARSVEEAILWHGGEAAQSRSRFMHLSQEQRRSLIAFVKSL